MSSSEMKCSLGITKPNIETSQVVLDSMQASVACRYSVNSPVVLLHYDLSRVEQLFSKAQAD